MSAERWRVVFADGGVCSVAVESVDGLFVASRPNVATGVARTAHAAVLRVDGVRGHDVAEVLAPGQQSRAELIAIIAGRTTPPTDAEIAAHEAAGGRWLISHMHADAPLRSRRLVYVLDAGAADARTEARSTRNGEVLWVALLDGRPCAWPIAEVQP